MTSADIVDTKLHELLWKNRLEYHIEVKGLANHMQHGLVALAKLGATPGLLQHYYDRYKSGGKKGSPLEPRLAPSGAIEISDANWTEYLGKGAHYSELVDYFTACIEKTGLASVLNKCFPVLESRIGDKLAHPVIQLGYALLVADRDPRLAAEGLAYMVYSNRSLGTPTPNDPGRAVPAMDILESVRHDASLENIFGPEDRVLTKLDLLSSEKSRAIFDRYDIHISVPQNATKDVVAESVTRQFALATTEIFAYVHFPDFVLLHLVTGFHALSQVFNYFDDVERIISAARHFWRATVAFYILQGRKELERPQPFEESALVKAWPELVQAVFDDVDREHLIKLVFVLQSWDSQFGPNPLFVQVASKALPGSGTGVQALEEHDSPLVLLVPWFRLFGVTVRCLLQVGSLVSLRQHAGS